jgi:hypothetical protein
VETVKTGLEVVKLAWSLPAWAGAMANSSGRSASRPSLVWDSGWWRSCFGMERETRGAISLDLKM